MLACDLKRTTAFASEYHATPLPCGRGYFKLWVRVSTIRYIVVCDRREYVTYTVDDPELVEKLQVDKEGRLYLGKDLANTDVRVSVEVLERHGENE